MTDYSVSCDGVEPDADGVLYALVVYYNGESFYSYLVSESDVASRNAENTRTTLLEAPLWFTDIWRSASSMLLVTDADGQVHQSAGRGWNVQPVSERALNTVWGLHDELAFAGGDNGQVYRWDGSAWSTFSPSLGGKILCIRGTASNDLYVCGEDALFWHYDGREWTRIELPTNQVLVGLLTLASNDIIVSGQGGVLFRGSGTYWSDVSQPGYDFHKMALFNGTIYIAGGGDGVFTFDGANVTNVKSTFASYRLSANEKYLSSAGGNMAARYDGVAWFGTRYS